MVNPITYHDRIKNEQHIFLFAVSGRSSSTAFQRILNSSNKVWLWGESQTIVKQMLFSINKTHLLSKEDRVKYALNVMYHSYLDNKHVYFYPSAIGNLENTTKSLRSTLSIFLKPWAPSVKRFGCKEIDLTPIWMLEVLKETYPNCFIIFCFRDPLSQWPSLCKLNLQVSKDLDLYLNAYEEMAITYLKFGRKHGVKVFIENKDLREMKKVEAIIKYLNIPEIDDSLIDRTVHTLKHKELSEVETEKILTSPAYKLFKKMQRVSKKFYKEVV